MSAEPVDQALLEHLARLKKLTEDLARADEASSSAIEEAVRLQREIAAAHEALKTFKPPDE